MSKQREAGNRGVNSEKLVHVSRHANIEPAVHRPRIIGGGVARRRTGLMATARVRRFPSLDEHLMNLLIIFRRPALLRPGSLEWVSDTAKRLLGKKKNIPVHKLPQFRFENT